MVRHAGTRTLLDEIEVFDARFQELRAKYPGRWVAIHNGEVVGDFGDFENAEQFAQNEFGDRPVFIELADEAAYAPSATVWSD